MGSGPLKCMFGIRGERCTNPARFQVIHDDSFVGCFCGQHLKEIAERCGEDIQVEDLDGNPIHEATV